ncbi:enoyl-CoA hydratase/isomerase family protein [Streptomyces acidicola]|uniref:Enoyl-CoA hydratase/isomerase family protein n=1 Tax=Streptomyces acidicola TaxID=2596892 RepID=A0A5N8WNQ9_9ACTN|nr:enoyl-CoA hydratase/isomerase family protein [Streptomyces acidicola]MPY48158.1 enoyl-CoA hydratase/isomerase family protein [Streptomyces acidicola]
MTYEAVRYEQDGAVARITLARPSVSNAIDFTTAMEFAGAVRRAASDEIRAVLISGEGKRFCSGGDLNSMAEADDPATYVHALATELDRALRDLSALPKPVISAVHGSVAGAGLGLVLSSDIVVAARSTQFLWAYAGVGLTPDCGVSYLLPRAVGQQRALDLALTGRVLSSDEASQWGLVAEVTDDGEHWERGSALAAHLARAPSYALAGAKRLIGSAWEVSREESSENEADTIAEAVTTDDAVALIAAFTSASRRG